MLYFCAFSIGFTLFGVCNIIVKVFRFLPIILSNGRFLSGLINGFREFVTSMAVTQYSRANPMLWYEINYHTLLQLVPELKMDITKPVAYQRKAVTKLNSVYHFDMSAAHLSIRILELNRYTQHLQITNHFKSDKKLLPTLSLNVRAYHDASVIEVISCSGTTKLLPDYTYPNEKMLLKDEKRQANRLLYEWLSSARAYYRFEPVSI